MTDHGRIDHARMLSCLRVTALILLGCLVTASCGVPLSAAELPERPHSFQAGVGFNGDDSNLDAVYRLRLLDQPDLGPFLVGGARPGRKYVLSELRPHFLLQRKEVRFFVGTGAESRLSIVRNLRCVAAGGVAYTWGDFSATDAAPDEGWTPMARAGLEVHANTEGVEFSFSLSYLYLDLRSAGPGWILATIGIKP